ncbi:hypothetical protein OS493_029333 [Desmophyllum pertusum]|uniref:Uncharacterized protein n=1 Tax=Desmophyllum pertusum TaxID=174260 RepID=A0A9W9Z9C3_9CNID|nr:hypothetical protein OS493_029333 [Desmophyllum pertusum]
MLPALPHRMKSRVSLYNVIPPIGAPIYNFQNRDEKIWATLQHIKEMEKAVSQQNSQAVSPRPPTRKLNVTLSNQDSNFVERPLSKTEKENNNIIENDERMGDEKCADLFEVPSSPSDSEVEFSIAGNVHRHAFRYSPSDQESSSDTESCLSVLANPMSISPKNASKTRLKNTKDCLPINTEYD